MVANPPGPSRKRLLIAFIVAPLAAPAVYAGLLLGPVLARAAVGSASWSSIGGAGELVLAVAAVGVPVAYGAALLAGAPIYFLLRRRGAVAPGLLWLAGALIGGIVALLLAPRLRGELFSIRFPLWAGVLLGILCAELFRRVLSPSGSRPGL